MQRGITANGKMKRKSGIPLPQQCTAVKGGGRMCKLLDCFKSSKTSNYTDSSGVFKISIIAGANLAHLCLSYWTFLIIAFSSFVSCSGGQILEFSSEGPQVSCVEILHVDAVEKVVARCYYGPDRWCRQCGCCGHASSCRSVGYLFDEVILSLAGLASPCTIAMSKCSAVLNFCCAAPSRIMLSTFRRPFLLWAIFAQCVWPRYPRFSGRFMWE